MPGATPRNAYPPSARVLLAVVCPSAAVSATDAPLTLYALQCWHSGEGALANLAIERALHLDQAYRMALLVDAVLRAGIPPQR